jgi:YHS domain-containing protein
MIRRLFLLCASILLSGQAFACGGSSCSANSCGGGCSCGKSHSSNQQCTGMSSSVGDQKTAIEVGNKICPVTKRKIGEMGPAVKFAYNGRVYNLCCPMCGKSFNKNPEKYSKIAEQKF